LTFRQIRYYVSRGKVPAPGVQEFSSRAEAAAWRAEQDRAWADFDWDSWEP
jgi:hypothetical protein